MNEQLPKEKRLFKDADPLSCGDVTAQLCDGTNLEFIEVEARNILSVSEAKALRNWLNEVLPS